MKAMKIAKLYFSKHKTAKDSSVIKSHVSGYIKFTTMTKEEVENKRCKAKEYLA